MKKCIKCGKVKELDMFYKHPRMGDGYLNKCKECCKADSRKNGKTERSKRYNRNRPNKAERNEKQKERMRKLKIENPEKYYEQKNKRQRKYREKYREKDKAHNIVAEAVKKGEIYIPDKCFLCEEKTKKLEAHHPDYAQPLYVIWLCSKCHHNIHKNMRTLKRNSI